jgi:hypothetical protein
MLVASPENTAGPGHQAGGAAPSPRCSQPTSKLKPESESALHVCRHCRLRTPAARTSSGSFIYFCAGTSRLRAPDCQRADTYQKRTSGDAEHEHDSDIDSDTHHPNTNPDPNSQAGVVSWTWKWGARDPRTPEKENTIRRRFKGPAPPPR